MAPDKIHLEKNGINRAKRTYFIYEDRENERIFINLNKKALARDLEDRGESHTIQDIERKWNIIGNINPTNLEILIYNNQ